MNKFGHILKRLRNQRGMSQRELADIINVDFTYISKIENNVESPPSEEVIIKVAETFGVNKYDLIIYADKTPSDFHYVIKVDNEVQKYLEEKVKEWKKEEKK